MNDQNIDLLIFAAAADGCRYIDDYVDEIGLSKKEMTEILHRMWQMGTLEKSEERNHDRGRPREAFTLAGEFSAMENNSLDDDLDLPS